MNHFTLVAIFAAGLAVPACDIFLDDDLKIGHEDEPCGQSTGYCFGELVCVGGTCIPLPGEGEACSLESLDDPCQEAACENGLLCMTDGTQDPDTHTCMSVGGTGEPCRCEYGFHDCVYKICRSYELDADEGDCDPGLHCNKNSGLCE